MTFDIDDVFQDESIDAVAIATPGATHAELARRALEARKHVFVEKPLATSLHDCETLLQLAESAGRRLFVGHIFFFHPVFERLSELLAVDPVTDAQFLWLKFGTFGEELIWNLLPHDIALARVFFGEMPERVTVLERLGIRTAIDVLGVRLDFGRGLQTCNIHVDRCATHSRKVVRVKTGSGNVFTWDENTLYRLDATAGFLPILEAAAEPLQSEASRFIKSLDESAPDFLTGAIALDVARIIESIGEGLCGVGA